jgi:hypothetical protein
MTFAVLQTNASDSSLAPHVLPQILQVPKTAVSRPNTESLVLGMKTFAAEVAL